MSDKRDQLLDAAMDLFCRHGFHAIGIDRVLAEAGVAKMTLYHHFESKEQLIVAALKRKDQEFRKRLHSAVTHSATAPGDQLLAIFDVLATVVCRPDYAGCAFANACAEYADADHPVHQAAAAHKQGIRDYVLELARAAQAHAADELAAQLCVLIDGALVTTHICRDRSVVTAARSAAAVLLHAQGVSTAETVDVAAAK